MNNFRVKIKLVLLSLFIILTITNSVSVANNSSTSASSYYPNNISNSETNSDNQELQNKLRFDYIAHDPIHIDSDDDFATLGFPGSGTHSDPYIIKGYNITSTTSVQYGIYISAVSKVFVIENCYISSPNIRTAGIYITDIDKGIATVKDNYLSTHEAVGIYIENSDVVNVINNTIIDTLESIELSKSTGTILINNTMQESTYSCYIYKSPYTQLINNTLIDQYLEFDFLNDHNFATITAENNTVNGKELLFLTLKSNLTIDSHHEIGQLFLVNCSNIVIKDQFLSDLAQMLYIIMSDNITVRNVTLTRNQYYYGLYISYGTNIWIENCTFSYNTMGTAVLTHLNNLTITNCVFESNDDFSISAVTTALISNNTYHSPGRLHLLNVNLCTIRYNIILYSGTVIWLENSASCNIYYNIFVKSHGYDDANTNRWYNALTRKGNSWSDWVGYGTYSISGSGNAEDKYPTSDFDDDNIKDLLEISQYNTDPYNPDTDGDGLKDGSELLFDTNPANPDTDGDGLNDTCEIYTTGTNPRVADTDGDGLKDGEEVNVFNTNPFDTDTDSDGLKDGEEVNNYKTDPNKIDTDGDTYTDYEEIEAGTDPLDANSYPSSTETTNTSMNTNANSTNSSEMFNVFGYNISKTPDLYGIISLILSGLAVIGVFVLLIRNIKQKPKRK